MQINELLNPFPPFTNFSGRKDEFESMIAILDRCQKSLTEYMRSKRAIFPRFNFISDDELLSILGSSDPAVIQEHIGKMFDNLDKFRLVLDNDRYTATALISYEKEIMEFRNSVTAEGNIEIWMGVALEEMKRSNRYITKKTVYDYGKVPRIISTSLRFTNFEVIFNFIVLIYLSTFFFPRFLSLFAEKNHDN